MVHHNQGRPSFKEERDPARDPFLLCRFGVEMLFVDRTTQAVEWALKAQSERQRVVAHNIANVNTPGFQASKVDFEASLAQALRDRRGGIAKAEKVATNDAAGLNGNNVSLEKELEALDKSNIHYEALTTALTSKFNNIRTAIGRR
jgi:flagellar basal-body rod protein FlgB